VPNLSITIRNFCIAVQRTCSSAAPYSALYSDENTSFVLAPPEPAQAGSSTASLEAPGSPPLAGGVPRRARVVPRERLPRVRHALPVARPARVRARAHGDELPAARVQGAQDVGPPRLWIPRTSFSNPCWVSRAVLLSLLSVTSPLQNSSTN
jgi:hypothetical protein